MHDQNQYEPQKTNFHKEKQLYRCTNLQSGSTIRTHRQKRANAEGAQKVKEKKISKQ